MSATTLNDVKKRERILSIDRFRGTVIFCMIIFQLIANFHNLGIVSHISSHAPDANAIYFLPNFAIADIVAPMFIFAIALSYIPSSVAEKKKNQPNLRLFIYLKDILPSSVSA